MASSCTREGSGWIFGKIYSSEGGEVLEQAVQGSDGLTVSGGVQETCSCGPKGHGLVGMERRC